MQVPARALKTGFHSNTGASGARTPQTLSPRLPLVVGLNRGFVMKPGHIVGELALRGLPGGGFVFEGGIKNR